MSCVTEFIRRTSIRKRGTEKSLARTPVKKFYVLNQDPIPKPVSALQGIVLPSQIEHIFSTAARAHMLTFVPCFYVRHKYARPVYCSNCKVLYFEEIQKHAKKKILQHLPGNSGSMPPRLFGSNVSGSKPAGSVAPGGKRGPPG